MTNTLHKVEDKGVELRAEKIAGSDPLLSVLTRREVSPILSGMVFAVIGHGAIVLTAWYSGYLRTKRFTVGILDDPATYMTFVFGAVVWAYYTWMPGRIERVFKMLYTNGVIGAPMPKNNKGNHAYTSFASFATEMQSSFERRWWFAASLIVAICITYGLIRPQYIELGQKVVWSMDPLNRTVTLLWDVIVIYCLSLLVIYKMLSIHWLNRMFNFFEIRVRPLHGDGAGGLSPLGHYALTSNYLIAFIGIALVADSVTRHYVFSGGEWGFRFTTELWLGLVIYLVIAPVLFFAPLSVAHRAMRDAKDELILQIARRFEVEYTKIQDALGFSSNQLSDVERSSMPFEDLEALQDRDASTSPNEDIPDFERSLKSLSELQVLHDITSSFPVWPFNAVNLRRFGASYLSPVILAVVIELLGRLIAGS